MDDMDRLELSFKNKDTVVRLRVNEEERAWWANAAAQRGLTLSAWLRQVANRASGVIVKT